MTEANEKRINELVQDEAFMNKFIGAASMEEKQALLKSEGVDLTLDELRTLVEDGKSYLLENGLMSQDGELSEDMLENVAGGKWSRKLLGLAIGVGSGLAGCPGGVILGAAMFMFG